MGWCCENDDRVECSERPDLEMFCNYDYPFYEQLKYMSCIRETAVCGTSQELFHAIPGINQTLVAEKKAAGGSVYGEVCRYELRQPETNIPIENYINHGVSPYVRLYVSELENIRLVIAEGESGKAGNKRAIKKSPSETTSSLQIVNIPLDFTQSLYLLTIPNDDSKYWKFNLTFQSIKLLDVESETDEDGNLVTYFDQFLVSESSEDVEGEETNSVFEYDAEVFWKWLIYVAILLTIGFLLAFFFIAFFNCDKEIGRNPKLKKQITRKRGRQLKILEESVGEFVTRRKREMQALKALKLKQTTKEIFEGNKFGIVQNWVAARLHEDNNYEFESEEERDLSGSDGDEFYGSESDSNFDIHSDDSGDHQNPRQTNVM